MTKKLAILTLSLVFAAANFAFAANNNEGDTIKVQNGVTVRSGASNVTNMNNLKMSASPSIGGGTPKLPEGSLKPEEPLAESEEEQEEEVEEKEEKPKTSSRPKAVSHPII